MKYLVSNDFKAIIGQLKIARNAFPVLLVSRSLQNKPIMI